MTRLALIALALLLSACVPAYLAVRAANADKTADPCGTAQHQALLGQPLLGQPHLGQPLQPSADLPPGTRIIRPGDTVTDDFSETRLNVVLDSQDIVTSLTCG
jgi:hypothetical protein